MGASAIGLIGSNGITITEPADQTLVKDDVITPIVFSPSGGTGIYAVTVYSGNDGDLPPGLAIAATGGGTTATITGTPTGAFVATDFVFRIEDTAGGIIVSDPINFQVADDFEPAVSTAETVGLTKSKAFTYQLEFTGGLGPVTWTLKTGGLPAGIAPVTFAGLITGTPTTVSSTASTFEGTDSNGKIAVTATITWQVNEVLAISQGAVNVTEGVFSSISIVATGGTPPFFFSIENDDPVPDGMVTSQDGGRTLTIEGDVGTTLANFDINVQVEDSVGEIKETTTFTITTV